MTSQFRRRASQPSGGHFGVVKDREDDGDVENVLESLRPERLTKELDPIWRERVEEWGDAELEDLGLEPSFDMLNPRVVRHLEEFAGDRIEGLVDDTTRSALRESLVDGVRAGEGIRELKARVSEVFDGATGYRAERIARTEVLRSSNFATTEAQRMSGIVSKRQWVSTLDDRTRETHAELSGQERGIDEPFEVDGKQAMHPGDFGDPSEDCSCRCTTVAIIDEPKSAETLAAVWKAYDRKLLPWERQAKRALKRGFKKQRADVLAALEEVFGG